MSVIAAGSTADVLRDENVMRAYLGTEDDVGTDDHGEASEEAP